MKIRRLAALALLPALLLAAPLPGCDQVEAQEAFDLAARTAPSGYTETTNTGEVVRRDPDDWRISPAFATRIALTPAFPNPATGGSLVRVGVTIFEFEGAPNGLVLYRRTADGVLVRLDSRTTSGPGAYELSAPGNQIGRGLVRLVVADAFGVLVTYGDVQVQ